MTKLKADGSSLLYSTYVGGSGFDGGVGIAVGTGSAYVVGTRHSGDFLTTAGTFDRSFNGRYDAFVTKLGADGSSLIYSTYLGGSGTRREGTGRDSGAEIAVNGTGTAYATGFTNSRDFPTTRGVFDRTYNGRGDAFVAKLNSEGSGLAYSTYLGGSEYERATASRSTGPAGPTSPARQTRRTSPPRSAPSTAATTLAKSAMRSSQSSTPAGSAPTSRTPPAVWGTVPKSLQILESRRPDSNRGPLHYE